MKHLALFLFLALLSCKNVSKSDTKSETETTTEEQVQSEHRMDNSVYQMWANYTASNPEFKDEDVPESDFFHNNRQDANRLASLTLTGKKKATSGLYRMYQHYEVELPKEGEKQIVTDFDGMAIAIIEYESVDIIPFNEISEEYAEWDMGTAVGALEKWKKAHWDFFEPFLKEIDEKPTEEMRIVCLRFNKIWPEY